MCQCRPVWHAGLVLAQEETKQHERYTLCHASRASLPVCPQTRFAQGGLVTFLQMSDHLRATSRAVQVWRGPKGAAGAV